MASDITLSKGVRSNLLSLQSTAELLGRTQERLSTGKKVNSALDNPINFFTSSGLSARANDLSRLLDSVGNGVQTINAADKGITAIKKLIESAQATARQALTAGEGTTSYSVSTTGSVAVTADTNATGTGSVTFAADVAAVNSANTFTSLGSLQAEEMATGTLDVTNFAANMTDAESLSLTVGSTTYNFVAQDTVSGTNGTPANTFYFDTQDGATGLRDAINSALTGVASAALAGNDLTVTADVANEAVTFAAGTTGFAGGDISSTAYQAADTLTINDGNSTHTFTYVSGAANTAAGEFNSLSDLETAINAVGGGLTVTADTVGDNLRLVADDASSTITVGGDVGTGLGFTGTYNASNSGFNSTLAALAGQSLSISVGSASSTANISATTTRASLLADINGDLGFTGASFTGNALTLSANNNSAEIEVSGTAAAGVGFGSSNDEFGPTNAQITGFTGQMTFQLGSGAVQSIEFNTGAGEVQTRAQLADRLAEISSTMTGVTLSIDSNNRINVSSESSENLTIGGSAAASFGVSANTYAPTVSSTDNATRASLQADFNNLLSQISTLAQDASYNGVNLLNGDNLSVIFNEDGSSSLSITGVDFSASGLGLTNVATGGFQSNAGVNASLAQLDAATSTLRTQSSRFGSNLSIVQTRQDFTKNLINVLQSGADNLVLADTNEEGANMLALQTRQQLSSVALSMASQADQSVLRLF